MKINYLELNKLSKCYKDRMVLFFIQSFKLPENTRQRRMDEFWNEKNCFYIIDVDMNNFKYPLLYALRKIVRQKKVLKISYYI